jgi:hypothetical protein
MHAPQTTTTHFTARRNLTRRIERFLGVLEREQREPDRWEAEHVMQALACLDVEDFASGEQSMMQAERPAEERSAEEVASVKASIDEPTTASLQANLERIVQDLASGAAA